MPSDLRVLGVTALCTAVLVWVAWWLGQQHDVLVHQAHEVQAASAGLLPRITLPSLSWGEEARAMPVMTPDAGYGEADASLDAGPDNTMRGTEAELAAILIPAICNRRRNECQCTEYPSRFAPEEERIGATTCEQDTLRDFRIWWRNNIHGPVVIVPEPELTNLLYDLVGCSGFHGPISRFLRADAVAGEVCESADVCRDDSPCEDGQCIRFQQLGESCWMYEEEVPPEAERGTLDCAHGLHCVAGRCEVDPEQAWRPVSPRRCRRGTFERVLRRESPFVSECVAAHAPCAMQSDCGFGFCAGAGGTERRCVVAEERDEDLGDHGRVRCCRVWCARRTTCRCDETQNVCVPVVGEGERCEHAECGRGTACASLVPGGGECIARSCLTSHTFGPMEIEPEEGESDSEMESEEPSDGEAVP